MLKVLVGVKKVVDYAAKIRVLNDGSGVDLSTVKMSMNPFCAIALEEAVRLKEQGKVSEITVMTAGPKSAAEVLRTALAMGADKAIHVETEERPDKDLLSLPVAKILKCLVLRDDYKIVLLGKQSIDSDNNQTGQLLAGMLNWPQGTFLHKLQVVNNTITAIREIDGGLQTIEFSAPAVLTCDLRLNTPRLIAIPDIMRAKKKPLEVLKPSALNVNTAPAYNTVNVEAPAKRKSGIMIENVEQLLYKLKNEAKVIN
jgi:electron transfer flavoprotein beta subunit